MAIVGYGICRYMAIVGKKKELIYVNSRYMVIVGIQ